MKISTNRIAAESFPKNCLIIGLYEEEMTEVGKKIDQLMHGQISHLQQQGTFRAKLGQTLPLFYTPDMPFTQLLLVGCGKKAPLNSASFCKIVTSAMKTLQTMQVTAAVCYLNELEVSQHDLTWKAERIAEIAYASAYRFDQYKTEKEPALKLAEIILPVHSQDAETACQAGIQMGSAIAEGVTFTKNLGNTPSNICTPTYLAEQAIALAETHPQIQANILDENTMKQLGMGALLAVSQGSQQEAKLICVDYQGGDKPSKTIVLVGKGVTFDTGGNSLKPAESMVGMKFDMCGAASVLGALKAAALLQLPIRLVGIIPAVENMPGGSAYKPEDIVTSLSGQTIEVLNTDAEGRLALCDALTYAARYQPDLVIDIATLTGAAVIALGTQTSALLGNDQPLINDLLKAGEETNDRAWQMPLWEEYQEQIKSPFADMANTGGRTAGTITAACFLSRFTKKYRWAHLDVAGSAAFMMSGAERAATGRPVPLLVRFLINQCPV